MRHPLPNCSSRSQTETMVSSKKWLVVPGLGALVAVALLIAALSRESVLHSDPASLRESKYYDRILGPAQTVETIKASGLDSFKVSTNENSLELTYEHSDSAEYDFSEYTVHHVSTDHRFAFRDGSILLDGLGVAFLESGSATNGSSTSIPTRYYHPDSQPFNELDIEKRLPNEWDRKSQIYKPFPTTTFLFSIQGLEERKILGASLFDARTHKRLSGGYSFSAGNDSSIQLMLEMQMWHTGPVEFVLTLAHGEVEEFRIRPEVGETIDVGKGKLRLIGIGNGRRRSSQSNSNGTTNRVKFQFSESSDDRGVTLVFAVLPRASWIPIDLDFLDDNGDVLRGAGSGRTGHFAHYSTRVERNKVAAVRVKYYPTVKRLVFHLSEIPGLPEENRGVENLFDVRIPYARVSQEYEFRNLITETVQMSISPYGSPNMPPGYFPITFTNATPLTLLDEYLKHLPDRRFPRIDAEKHTITLEPPYAIRLLNKIKQLIRDKF